MTDIDITQRSDFENHNSRHESGGGDEISVEGLSGLLADAQDPLSHDNAAHTTNYIPDTEKASANGVATLNGSSEIPNDQIPDLAITETFTVTNESDLTTLSNAEIGDVGIVTSTDPNESYILTGDYATQSNWTRIAVEQAPVSSVNGETGAVSLDSADVGAAPDPHDNTNHTTNYSADSHDHSGGDSPSEINPDKVDSSEQLDPPTVASRSNIPTGQTGIYYIEDEDTLTYRVS
jgi:hypothetical protein